MIRKVSSSIYQSHYLTDVESPLLMCKVVDSPFILLLPKKWKSPDPVDWTSKAFATLAPLVFEL